MGRCAICSGEPRPGAGPSASARGTEVRRRAVLLAADLDAVLVRLAKGTGRSETEVLSQVVTDYLQGSAATGD